MNRTGPPTMPSCSVTRYRPHVHAGNRYRRFAAWLLLTVPVWAGAQTESPALPNAGQLLQQVQPAPAPARPAASTPLTVPQADGQAMPAGVAFEVRSIAFTGNTLIATETLTALLADAVGRSLTLAQLDELAGRVTAAYRQAGQPLARAIVPAQTIEQGRVTLQVIEARFGAVRLTNRSRNSDRLLNDTLSAMASGELVSQERLDHALLRLADIPGVNATATLAPGERVGTSDVLVAVQPRQAATGQLTMDNQGSSSTGRARLSGVVNLFNPLGLGDVLSANALSSGKGLQYARVSYDALVHGSGTRAGVAVSNLHYELVGSLAALQAHGTAQVQGLSLRQPLLRRGDVNLSGTLAIDRTRLRDRVDSSAIASDRSLDTASVGLQFDRADDLGPPGTGGVTLASVVLTRGQVGFDNTTAELADAAGARTQGGFSKWTAVLLRQQSLGPGTSAYVSLIAQGASGNLDASQKFSAGGPNGVRAYDAGVATGDEGQLLSLELRQAVTVPGPGQWQALAFADAARITTNRRPWVGANAVNHVSLRGVGLGLAWMGAEGWQGRLTVATPVGALPAGLQTTGATRVWLDLTVRF
jgi:hemolysin activation/secretion protein